MKKRAKRLANKIDGATSDSTKVWSEGTEVKVDDGSEEVSMPWRVADWTWDLHESGEIDNITEFIKK